MQGEAKFMREAIRLATENVGSGRGGPFGAVIVRGGEIVGQGANCVTALNDPTAHGEVMAIRDACTRLGTFDLSGCSIYTSCEPCPMCLAAILWARCAEMFFGNTAADAAAAGFDDSKFYEQVRLPVGERELPSENMLRGEALASFAAWQESLGRIDY